MPDEVTRTWPLAKCWRIFKWACATVVALVATFLLLTSFVRTTYYPTTSMNFPACYQVDFHTKVGKSGMPYVSIRVYDHGVLQIWFQPCVFWR